MGAYRLTFVGGLAVGYGLGAQAGRERYEQLKRLARKAAESPAMQQTAGALHAQATATAKTAKDTAKTATGKATTGMRKSAAKVSQRTSAASRTRSPARTRSGNGEMPRATGSDDHRPFLPVNGNFGEHTLTA